MSVSADGEEGSREESNAEEWVQVGGVDSSGLCDNVSELILRCRMGKEECLL